MSPDVIPSGGLSICEAWGDMETYYGVYRLDHGNWETVGEGVDSYERSDGEFAWNGVEFWPALMKTAAVDCGMILLVVSLAVKRTAKSVSNSKWSYYKNGYAFPHSRFYDMGI